MNESSAEALKVGHTPGPWSIRDHEERGDDFAICGPDEEGIANVDGTDLRGHYIPTAEANARLIAAAPGLLEALEEARAALVRCDEEPDTRPVGSAHYTIRQHTTLGMWERIDAAIAQATGGAA